VGEQSAVIKRNMDAATEALARLRAERDKARAEAARLRAARDNVREDLNTAQRILTEALNRQRPAAEAAHPRSRHACMRPKPITPPSIRRSLRKAASSTADAPWS
jgi:hypothetical protein